MERIAHAPPAWRPWPDAARGRRRHDHDGALGRVHGISTLNESSSTLGSSTGIKIVKPPFANPGQYAYAAQTYIFGQQAPAGTEQQIPLSTR